MKTSNMEPFYNGILLLLIAVSRPASSLFVPEQLPTLLSFVYTNIPPIRKGIDSRVGFGFRLGPNADVQVMLELGPQQNTAPIGPQKGDSSKRETKIPSRNYHPSKYRAPVKGSWLQSWKQQQALVENDEDVGVMPAQPAMDKDIVAHLQQLYKEQPTVRDGRKVKTPQENVPTNKGIKEKERRTEIISPAEGTEVIETEEVKEADSLDIQDKSKPEKNEKIVDPDSTVKIMVVENA